ncbi:MAG: hypothetical protein CL946_13170 [Ectothiorhodospiraceae bacterium]|nr:hypothetical protein [Ectothiorhodospiraceae bacterium]
MPTDAMNTYVDVNEKRLGLKGYDPVAYFQVGRPQAGSPDYTFNYEGVKYRFASRQNLILFMKDPERYLPAYGGFCSFGVSEGLKLDTDPAAFKIVDGKLYLNNCMEIHDKWLGEQERIERANKNWPDVLTKE